MAQYYNNNGGSEYYPGGNGNSNTGGSDFYPGGSGNTGGSDFYPGGGNNNQIGGSDFYPGGGNGQIMYPGGSRCFDERSGRYIPGCRRYTRLLPRYVHTGAKLYTPY